MSFTLTSTACGDCELFPPECTTGLVLDEADLETVWEPGRPRFYERLRRLLG